MEDTIVSLRFSDVDRAQRALSEFRQRDRDRRLQVRGAVLVQRSPQGAIDVPQPHPHGDGAEVRGADEAEKAKLP